MGSSSLKRKSVEDTQTLRPLPASGFDPDEQFDAMGFGYVDDEDAVIYGLDEDIDEDESKAVLRTTLRYVIVGVVAAAFIIGGLMVVKPFGTKQPERGGSKLVASETAPETENAGDETAADDQPSDAGAEQPSDANAEQSTDANAEQPSDANAEQPSDAGAEKSSEASDAQSQNQGDQGKESEGTESDKEAKDDAPQESDAKSQKAIERFTVDDLGEVVTTTDLDRLVHFISFDGYDLSIPEADMYTRISGARVEVVHVLHDIVHAKPLTMAGNASRRAAALATMLADRKVQGPGDQKPTPFNDVLWRITNVRGETFIALTFYSGFAPTSGEPLWVLMQSPYYCMSESLYNALNHAAPKNGGGLPRALDGSTITASASLESGNLD